MATELERSRSAIGGLSNSSSTEDDNNNETKDPSPLAKLPPATKRPVSVPNAGKYVPPPPPPPPKSRSYRRHHRPLTSAQSVDSPPGTSPVTSPPIGIKPFAVGGLATSAASYREAAEARSQILNEIKSLQVKRSSSFKRMIRGIPKSLSSGHAQYSGKVFVRSAFEHPSRARVILERLK